MAGIWRSLAVRWLTWTVVTAAGLPIAMAFRRQAWEWAVLVGLWSRPGSSWWFGMAETVLGVVIGGAVLGAAQALAWRERGWEALWWVPATAVGALLTLAAAEIATRPSTFGQGLAREVRPGWEVARWALIGAAFGAGQAPVVGRWAGWRAAVGWVLASCVAVLLTGAAYGRMGTFESLGAPGWVTAAGMLLPYAAVTGFSFALFGTPVNRK